MGEGRASTRNSKAALKTVTARNRHAKQKAMLHYFLRDNPGEKRKESNESENHAHSVGGTSGIAVGNHVHLWPTQRRNSQGQGRGGHLWCYLEGGDHGADHKQSGIMCAKAGNPIGLVTEKGEVYIMMGLKDHQPGKEVLIDKMADTVTVEGILVKKGGTQVIYVSAVKE